MGVTLNVTQKILISQRVRLSLIIAMTVGPFAAALFNGLSEEFFDKRPSIFGWRVFVPGVRFTLWLAAIIILGAGVLARASVRNLTTQATDQTKEEEAGLP